MNSWVKNSVPAELSPAAVVVALERDLLLTSLSRPTGSAAPISPHAVPSKAGPAIRAAAEVITLVRRGEYLGALSSPQARALLCGPDAGAGADLKPGSLSDAQSAAAAADAYNTIATNVALARDAAAVAGGVEPAAHALLALAVGVASLNAFQQVNVTGPGLANAPQCPFPSVIAQSTESETDARWNRFALTELSVDGEDLVGRCRLPQYLLLARFLLPDRLVKDVETLVPEDVTGAQLQDARAAAAKRSAKDSKNDGRVRLWSEPVGIPMENSQQTAGDSAGDGSTGSTAGDVSCSPTPPSLAWWSARQVLAHQRLLSGRSPTLRRNALGLHALSLLNFAPDNKPARVFGATTASPFQDNKATNAASVSNPTQTLLASMSLLEASLMEHEYGHVDSARALLEFACSALGVRLELVGKMGFRTVHQQDAKAQMVLEVSCDGLPVTKRADQSEAASDDETDDEPLLDDASATGVSKPEKSAAMARIATELQGLSVDGSQVLTTPRLGNVNEMTDVRNENFITLPAAAQALVLASAVTVRKSQSDDGTRSWAIAPYHEIVQSQVRSRPVLRAAAAVFSSRHERERARTRERSLLLLEDLVRGLDLPAPSPQARARYAYSVWFPPSSALRKELGESLIGLGMVGPALELFEEIELWDSLVVCLSLLGKKQQAADVVRRRLAVDPLDAKLWCALGDALDDENHYLKALEVSGNKSARALRSLARGAVAREDWVVAAQRWQEAMQLNPLFPEGWFSCGYALLKAKREDEALSAFTRCTQIDCENGQAWNNVAALNIRKNRFPQAHVALREAVKQIRGSWQTWENLAMVSCKVGHFQQSARALLTVLDLTDGTQLHLPTLASLVERCVEARDGVATWLGVEDTNDAATRLAEEKRKKTLGQIAELAEDESSDDESETWDGVGGGTGAADAGDAAADMLGAFFSDSEEEDDGENDDGKNVSDTTGNSVSDTAETAVTAHDKAKASQEIAGQVLAREVVRLESSVEDVFKRALGGGSSGERPVTESSEIWRLVAEFRTARSEWTVASEARLKRVRALDGTKWRKDQQCFVEYTDASLEMCRGSVRAATASRSDDDENTSSPAEIKRNVSQARMHLRGLIKVGEAMEWGVEMPEVFAELEKCAEEVAAAEAGLEGEEGTR